MWGCPVHPTFPFVPLRSSQHVPSAGIRTTRAVHTLTCPGKDMLSVPSTRGNAEAHRGCPSHLESHSRPPRPHDPYATPQSQLPSPSVMGLGEGSTHTR